MPNRRQFINQSLWGASLLSNLSWPYFFISPKPIKKPVVMATWDNRNATAAAWAVLQQPNGYALNAVEAGARVPEADPNDTSVGYGGFPDRDGHVTLDACIMDEKGRAGSVAFLQHIKHPISVARKVMEHTPHVLLCGDGALDFALSQGFVKENLLTPTAEAAWKAWLVTAQYNPKVNWERHDTIGIVALDREQRIAGACSTSGMAFKMRGRVGDSPILGAGMYADQEAGAAAATGLGELMLRTLASFQVTEAMRNGQHPQKAVETTLRRIARKLGEEAKINQIGLVAVDMRGRTGAFGLQKGFNYAAHSEAGNQVFEAGYLF
jgi:N4-(beta-N-acetylglucosaminyl)-L-asparaginase